MQERAKSRGLEGFAFKEKLRLLKESLKVWNREVFRNLDTKIARLVLDLNESDEKASQRSLTEVETKERSQITNELWQARTMKVNLAHQKSRVR